MDTWHETDEEQIVVASSPQRKPRLRPDSIIPIILIIAILVTLFLVMVIGASIRPNQSNNGPHANLVAGDYLVWDTAIEYTPESVMHIVSVWNITGSNDRTFTMQQYGNYPNGTIEYNNESRLYSYSPRLGAAFSDSSNNNATVTIELFQTPFGEKRVYHYHCPQRSLGNGGYIPPSDSYIGVETNVVYKTISYSPGTILTITLTDTNSLSILNGDSP